MQTELTIEQKLEAVSLKHYYFLEWKPKKGDYYTTSRNDTQLYQIVDEDDDFFYTNYCDKSFVSENSKWSKESFLKDFGERRVYVPDFIFNKI